MAVKECRAATVRNQRYVKGDDQLAKCVTVIQKILPEAALNLSIQRQIRENWEKLHPSREKVA